MFHSKKASGDQTAPSSAKRPSSQLYNQLLVDSFEKIRKTAPRKCKELKDLCGDAIEQVNAETNEQHLSANKYFRIFKLAFDLKIPKLTEFLLYHIQKLIAHGMMDGNHPDDCFYPEGERPKSNGTLPRRLIDAIVDEICNCTNERDQQVQLQVTRALLTIVATNSTQVHERSLLKVMSSLYFIHIASTTPVNQSTAKASLMQLISIVFKKMEAHAPDHSDTLRRLNSAQDVATHSESPLLPNSASKQAESHRTEIRDQEDGSFIEQRRILASKKLQNLKHQGSAQELGRMQTTQASEQTLVTFTPEEQYAYVTLQYMVDQVCIHEQKTEEIRGKFDSQIKDATDEQLKEIKDQIEKEIDRVPIFTVLKQKKKGEDPNEDKTTSKKLVNEAGNTCGKFGWCVGCRGTANLYCKHTRHPVCSFECKQRHIKLLEDAAATEEQIHQTSGSKAESKPNAFDDPYARDALLIFNKLCQLLMSKDLDGKLDNLYGVKKVLLGLDLIHSCLENPGPTFINRREFVNVVRDQLCNALLKFAVSSEHQIFCKTVSIFYLLFLHFREHLKQTIGVLVDYFFLRILDSGNSEYDYKYSILEFFDRISESSDHLLEIYANYDCDIGQKDICFRIIESLSGIAQGRFQRSDHSSVLTHQQETSLRRQALEILVKILKNLNRAIKTEQKLETLAQQKLAESRQERAEMMLRQQREKNSDFMEEDESQSNKDDDNDAEDTKRKSDASYSQASPTENMEAKQQIQNRLYKQEMAKAASKFNLKPKNGLKYLTDKGYLPTEPREEYIKRICKFFKETPALSATTIGQFLAEDKELNRDVLSHYIDEFDFSSPKISFIDALKLVLSGFRLPGEGQQVDRIMQKFGEKLSRDRPIDFGNADGVYILAYATLMLQTSVHNPQAQKLRMTLADFKKICSGVKLSDSQDINLDSFLTDIYENVLRDPFTLEEDEEARMKLEAATNTNKKQLFDREREGILRKGANMLKQDNKNNRFVLVKDISTIKPLFENTWSAYLAVFSVILDESDDIIVSDICIQGFMHAVRISGYFEIHEVRNAFVSSLSKFTLVTATKEIKQKNILCIREMLNLAIYDGDCLRDSWSYVLECISKIDHMRVLGLGDLTDSEYFQSETGTGSSVPTQANQQVLLRNSAIIAEQIDAHQIEQIFLQSEKLSPDAIIDFIKYLCKVSTAELADEDNPKKFCLQKLVEVTSLNMGRVRFQWQAIWQTIGEHFDWVGQHKNLHVVIYAIDSLRQLADKFLQIDERKNFSYQKDFLKPFETMLQNLHPYQKDIKEYIIMCIAALCNQKAKFIKSGWEVILNIFSLVAQDTEAHLVTQSFQSLDHLVQNNFTILESNFIELVNCVGKFCTNQQYYQRSQDLLMICSLKLMNQPQIVKSYIADKGREMHRKDKENMERLAPKYGLTHETAEKPIKNQQKDNTKSLEVVPSQEEIQISVLKVLWFPILRIFTSLIMERSEDVSRLALIKFRQILDQCHSCFSQQMWREILSQVIHPVLEENRIYVDNATKKQNHELINFHCKTVISLLDTLNGFFKDSVQVLPKNLLVSYTDILCLFASSIKTKTLATVAMSKLRDFIAVTGDQLDSKECLTAIITQLSLLFKYSQPKLLHDQLNSSIQELTSSDRSGSKSSSRQQRQPVDLKSRFEQSYAQSTTQLILSKCVEDIVNKGYSNISQKHFQVLLECLDQQFKFAKEFNSDLSLRLKLWKEGYLAEQKSLPGLLDLEEQSLKVYLQILFQLYFLAKEGTRSRVDEGQKVFELCSKVIKDYVLKHNELASINQSKQAQKPSSVNQEEALSSLHEKELENQIHHISPIIHQVILENLLLLSDEDLRHQVKDFGQLSIDLTLCQDQQVRNKNHKLLTKMFDQLMA